MTRYFAFLFGFAMLVAYAPGWSQPAMEPKSALLLLAGGFSWGWLSFKGRPLGKVPWTVVLPLGWLLLTAFWSPAPFLGLQRVLWFLAACGIASYLCETEDFNSFMKGVLAGTSLHALLIFLQWVPSIRAALPPSIGLDLQQGIGRGFFHNTNMAAQPLLLVAAWLVLSPPQQRAWGRIHLIWVLPALHLTDSRLAIGVCTAMLAFSALKSLKGVQFKGSTCWEGYLLAGLALLWSLLVHRWGWLFPLVGMAAGYLKPTGGDSRESLNPGPGLRAVILGVGLSVVFALPSLPTHSIKGPVTSQLNVVSSSQRSSYYHAGLLAFLDNPFLGQGLGSARPLYPKFVDRARPSNDIAYGDFTRPNNLHSEPLEILVEGGLALVLFLALGLWLDSKAEEKTIRPWALLPLLGLCLLDFPLHNPFGMLWFAVAIMPSTNRQARPSYAVRLVSGAASALLVIFGLSRAWTATQRPVILETFGRQGSPVETHHLATRAWKRYPFDAELFDLYSKAAITRIALAPNADSAPELDYLLNLDPNDHHLLLARAQLARKLGDQVKAKECLSRYEEVAPMDPERFLRFAKDALDSGRPAAALVLLDAAEKQPGFGPSHRITTNMLRAKAIPSR
ncbi:MAG: O-antigen ligase family protein [Holophaga sp.]|nr:O-antigen ligase family protein [Holophaga sp.]